MLFNQRTLASIKSGRITMAFRRWTRPMVRPRTRMRTGVGEVEIVAVDEVAAAKVTAAEARQAGFASKSELLGELRSSPGRKLYRVKLRYAGRDRREALRARDQLSAEDIQQIRSRLARYDRASRRGPWTGNVLALIAKHPQTSAGKLAKLSGFEKAWLKINVRKLKELGLTESLMPGYRLSSRGRAYWKVASER